MATGGAVAYSSWMSTGPPLPAHLWDDLPPEAQAMILALRVEVTDLQTKVPGLQLKIQELQNQMSQDTPGSSGLPFPDPPTAKRQPPQSPGGGVATMDADTSPSDRLRELVRQSPRTFGKPRSTWTPQLLADVCL